VRVTPARGETLAVIPDAWLDVHVAQRARVCVLLELDRGTTEQRPFKRKLRALLAYADGPYQAQFDTESMTVAIATTAGPHRAQQILAWCEQVLRELSRQDDADIFLVGTVPPEGIDPRTFFLAPVWRQPFASAPSPLFDLAAVAA
jgi:hypothetical protein